MMNRSKIIALTVCSLMIMGVFVPMVSPNAQALPAGIQEFFTPLPSSLTRDIFDDIYSSVGDSEQMHYVVSIIATTDTTTIYYDHWENGYSTGATGDVSATLNRGQSWIRENDVPSNPRGTSTFFDGGDRIFTVGGPVQVVVSTWGATTGTVLADAWEVYPVQAWEGGTNAYVIPVGDELANDPPDYNDFQTVWIQVMSGSNSNTITIKNNAGTTMATTTLAKGGAYNYKITGGPGYTVSSTSPVQVQLITGDQAQRVDMRGYSVLPRADWYNSYYAPAPSWSVTGYTPDTDIYIYNPGTTTITVSYADRLGSGTFTVNANSVKSYSDGAGRYVPTNSGAHLSSSSTFWALASCDAESSAWDWAYSLIPANLLTTETFLGWAPGNQNKNADGSSVYITASVDNTLVTIYKYPDDGVADLTVTLNRLQTATYWDPDHDNTGMRIVASAPVAIAWGENPALAGTGATFLDMGYTVLPLSPEWVDIGLKVDKTANPDVVNVGDTTTFTIVISVPSSSWSGVTNIDLVDTLPPGWEYVTGSGSPSAPNSITGSLSTGYILTWDKDWTLQPGQSVTVTFDARATSSADTENLNRNVGTATGRTAVNPTTLTAEDDAFVSVVAMPDISLKKQVWDGAQWLDADTATGPLLVSGPVQFRVLVYNTGTSTLTNVQVTDPAYGGTISLNDTTLAPGEWAIGTFEMPWAAGQQKNTATATGSYGGQTYQDSDDAFYYGATPSIVLKKQVWDGAQWLDADTATGPLLVSGPVQFRVIVTNTNGVTLTNVQVTDPAYGGTISLNDTTLAPGEWAIGTFEMPWAAGQQKNTATATGSYGGQTYQDSDDAFYYGATPSIQVTKEGPTEAEVGDVITYYFNVTTGTGNVPLSNVGVNDNVTGTASPVLSGSYNTGDTNTNNLLDPGEIWQFIGTWTIQVDDPNPLLNTATATGYYLDTPVTDSDDHSIAVSFSPQIIVDKTGPATANVGDEVNYTITVTIDPVNGDQSDVYNLQVTDPLGTPVYYSGDDGDGILELGETWTYYMLYTIQAGDLDPLPNTATATGDDRDGDDVTDSDDHSIAVSFSPQIEIIKTANVTSAKVGDMIHYTIIVQHAPGSDGSPINNIIVIDSLGGTLTSVTKTGGDQDDVLEAGEVWTFEYERQVLANDPNLLVNVANVTGEDNDGDEVTDEDEEIIPIEYNPLLLVIKTGPDSAKVGETITYTITVQHDPASDGSNISNIVVSDMFGITPVYVSGDDGDNILQAGEIWTYSVEYTVQADDPDPLVNTAIATGEDEDGDEVTDDDNEEVSIEYNPLISIEKSADVQTAKVGDIIHYTIVVQHAPESDGSPISNVVVTDSLGGTLTSVTKTGGDQDDVLKAGEVWTYTYERQVLSGDPDPLVNVANVTGEDNDGDEVTDEDDETIPIDSNPVLLVIKTGPDTAYVGDTITYTITVQHSPASDGTNIYNVAVSDVFGITPTYVGGDDGDNILEWGEIWTYTVEYTVQEGDPNPLINTAIATGEDEDGDEVTDDDEEVIPILTPAHPAICVDKTGPACAYVGDTITYTFRVYNMGNVPLSNVQVLDDVTGQATYQSGDDNNNDLLDVDEIWVFTSTWVVQESPNPLINTATATGYYDGVAVVDTDDHSLDVFEVSPDRPAICVDKTGPACAYVGDTITYTFRVYNMGNVPLSNVQVLDDVTGQATYQSGDDNNNDLLDVDEIWVFTSTWVVQESPNPLRNIGTATGYYDGVPYVDTDGHCVDVYVREQAKAGICLDKAGPACAYVGDTITYTFKVYNIGNVPLSSVTVVDSLTGEATYKSGDVNQNGLLDVNEVWVFTSSWIVQDSPDPLRNTAIATGYFGDVSYTAEDDHCVDVYKVVDESAEEVVDNNDAVGSDDNSGASTNDPQDATTMTGTGSGASFPWVLLIVGMIGAAVTIAAMAVYRRRSP